jgi:hypothetical protein
MPMQRPRPSKTKVGAGSWHKRQKQRCDRDQNGDCQKVSNSVMQPRIVGYWSNYHCIAFVLCAGPLILSAFIGNLIGRDFHILYRRPRRIRLPGGVQIRVAAGLKLASLRNPLVFEFEEVCARA